MSDFGSTTPIHLDRGEGKGLATGTLGLWGSTVIGLASTAPVLVDPATAAIAMGVNPAARSTVTAGSPANQPSGNRPANHSAASAASG